MISAYWIDLNSDSLAENWSANSAEYVAQLRMQFE
jgi:hypothetical protein